MDEDKYGEKLRNFVINYNMLRVIDLTVKFKNAITVIQDYYSINLKLF
ncbi:MAG: hypothetical protein KatS3mg129_2947 [Leptospiraceae bacterium]|nr:MAG: hypothetical protein KatS3mg129_2947 [Leptospiraceae bacterium]